MNRISFHYFADARRTLYDTEYQNMLPLMKKAGVDTLWMLVYNAGKYTAEKAEILRAKAVLEEKGFRVNALSLPVGHPGNALNPEDESLDLELPPAWRYRVLPDGNKEYFCACIEEKMIADNRELVEFCRDAGFAQLFFDDDLRMGAHGDKIRGCYCDHCLQAFSQLISKKITREEIARACEEKNELSEQWIQYNCDKITGFMKATAVSGIQTGIMVMHHGDRRHGIDIPAIRRAVPDCLFRVGEGHFQDQSFERDADHAEEVGGIRAHMELIGNPEFCYSETTVFPPNALSAENLVKKAELAIREGIRQIFLMSGTWLMTEPYWEALAARREMLEALAAE